MFAQAWYYEKTHRNGALDLEDGFYGTSSLRIAILHSRAPNLYTKTLQHYWVYHVAEFTNNRNSSEGRDYDRRKELGKVRASLRSQS
jgi:hypothetical protein